MLALPVLLALVSCQQSPVSQPVPVDANLRAVHAFLDAYGRRDLEGMMACLEEDAVFKGSGNPLSKPQIRDFFQGTFRKHPNLKVEAGPLRLVQGTIQVSVKVELGAVWTDTWIFETRNHKIHAYSLASAKR